MDDDYEVTENSKYRDIKVLAERGNLFLDNGNIVYWTMPVNSFLCFDEVYLLTYLFDGQIQKYYYDLHGVEYEKYSVQKNLKGRYELIQYMSVGHWFLKKLNYFLIVSNLHQKLFSTKYMVL
ncbi:hypothetical protein [Peribacillus frigoritolerans]|uniref:hypothetical protein n=1 Tax=Peribacillus frigoritolerans TaxID=450367 RepID=UPI0034179CD8